MQTFRALGAPPPDPRASGGWGLRPQTPQTAPSLRISGYAPALELFLYFSFTNVRAENPISRKHELGKEITIFKAS